MRGLLCACARHERIGRVRVKGSKVREINTVFCVGDFFIKIMKLCEVAVVVVAEVVR